MKFKINRDHLSNGLSQVLNVVGSKATSPILNNVLIEAVGDDRISLTTTNLDLGIRCSIKSEVKAKGALTLPVKKLSTIVRELPETEVTIETVGTTHQVKVSSGRSTFKIMGIGKEEFPPVADLSDDRAFTLDQSQVADMLRCVSYAQSQDETRFILNGVYFHFVDKKVTLVATDGRRLATVSRDLEEASAKAGHFILPARSVAELSRLLDKGEKLRIAFNDRRVAFQINADNDVNGFVDKLHLVSKVVEGNFPNYQQVVPKETHQRLKLERELLLECVHRAALVTSDKSNQVRLKLTQHQLEITAQSPDFGEAHEELAVEYTGPEVQIAFNPQYLIDPLKALVQDEVFFEFKDEVSPGVLKTNDHFLCVVMPVRLTA